MKNQKQSGVFLLEALIAILIFSLGILGMVAMGGTAIAAQSDAQYRTEASNFASEISANIALSVDRADIPGSLLAFAHLPTPAGYCNFAGSASADPIVNTWIDRVRGAVPGVNGLPGATTTSESIQVDGTPGAGNRVTVTVCWRPPSTNAMAAPWHRHVLVSYVN